jgi:hypothetical protein
MQVKVTPGAVIFKFLTFITRSKRSCRYCDGINCSTVYQELSYDSVLPKDLQIYLMSKTVIIQGDSKLLPGFPWPIFLKILRAMSVEVV